MANYRKTILDSYLSSFYDTVHNDLSSYGLGAGLQKYALSYRHNYGRLLPQNKQARILELGPGLGHFMMFIRNEGYTSISGIDGSLEVAKRCREEGLEVDHSEDFTAFLQGNPNTFDAIIANDILEHFTKNELFDLLEAARGALKPNGSIIGRVPNASAMFTGTHTRFFDFTHETSFTEYSLKQVFSSLKFSRVALFAQNYFCYFKNPLNYIGLLGAGIMKYLQLLIYRLHGVFAVRIVSANIIFKVDK